MFTIVLSRRIMVTNTGLSQPIRGLYGSQVTNERPGGWVSPELLSRSINGDQTADTLLLVTQYRHFTSITKTLHWVGEKYASSLKLLNNSLDERHESEGVTFVIHEAIMRLNTQQLIQASEKITFNSTANCKM